MEKELALELKRKGYPQDVHKHGGEYFYNQVPEPNERYIMPTLSELIEVCGEDFQCLTRGIDKWMASFISDETNEYTVLSGATPEEAVARLWLAINNKT